MPEFDFLNKRTIEIETEFELSPEQIEELRQWYQLKGVHLFFDNLAIPLNFENPQDLKFIVSLKILSQYFDASSGQIKYNKYTKSAKAILNSRGITIKDLAMSLWYAENGTPIYSTIKRNASAVPRGH